jgi:hypothetical protein
MNYHYTQRGVSNGTICSVFLLRTETSVCVIMSHYVLFLSLNKNMAYSLFTCYLLLPVTVHDQDC